jgi:hypothetical protein
MASSASAGEVIDGTQTQTPGVVRAFKVCHGPVAFSYRSQNGVQIETASQMLEEQR